MRGLEHRAEAHLPEVLVQLLATAGRGQELHEYFRKMGFSAVLKPTQRPLTVYRPGDVTSLVNQDPAPLAADFAETHAPCACGFAIRSKQPDHDVHPTALPPRPSAPAA
ncbi:hypothetical protein BU225_20195, partial [Stenotrophomonas sp. MB339]